MARNRLPMRDVLDDLTQDMRERRQGGSVLSAQDSAIAENNLQAWLEAVDAELQERRLYHSKQKFTIEFTEELYEQLFSLYAARRVPIRQIVIEILEAYFKAQKEARIPKGSPPADT